MERRKRVSQQSIKKNIGHRSDTCMVGAATPSLVFLCVSHLIEELLY